MALSDIPANTAQELCLFDPPKLAACDGSNPTSFSGIGYDESRDECHITCVGGHSITPNTSCYTLPVADAGPWAWSADYASTPIADMTIANFDEPNGRWLTTGHPLARHNYDASPYIPWLGEVVLLKGVDTGGGTCLEQAQGWNWVEHPGKMHYYHRANKTWRLSALPVVNIWGMSTEPDPVSQLVILIDPSGIRLLNPTPGAESVTRISRMGNEPVGVIMPPTPNQNMQISQNLIYVPPLDVFDYVRSDGRVFRFTPNRADWYTSTFTELVTTGDKPPFTVVTGPNGETGFAWDAENGVIGGAVKNGIFHAFDPVSLVWTATPILGGYPADARIDFHCLAYATQPQRYIWISKQVIAGKNVRKTWAFRYAHPQ